ncbi:Sensor protein ZraS [Trichinella spiralis]|uniref:Sensor protein ZraS n=1 Tax=Trichinella spiralis TaxID=6334 RepID=A0ABR3K8B7_TRISP
MQEPTLSQEHREGARMTTPGLSTASGSGSAAQHDGYLGPDDHRRSPTPGQVWRSREIVLNQSLLPAIREELPLSGKRTAGSQGTTGRRRGSIITPCVLISWKPCKILRLSTMKHCNTCSRNFVLKKAIQMDIRGSFSSGWTA